MVNQVSGDDFSTPSKANPFHKPMHLPRHRHTHTSTVTGFNARDLHVASKQSQDPLEKHPVPTPFLDLQPWSPTRAHPPCALDTRAFPASVPLHSLFSIQEETLIHPLGSQYSLVHSAFIQLLSPVKAYPKHGGPHSKHRQTACPVETEFWREATRPLFD
jgi:hypothetical protein